MSPRPVVGRSKEAMPGEEGEAEVRSSGFRLGLIWAQFPDRSVPATLTVGKIVSSSVKWG